MAMTVLSPCHSNRPAQVTPLEPGRLRWQRTTTDRRVPRRGRTAGARCEQRSERVAPVVVGRGCVRAAGGRVCGCWGGVARCPAVFLECSRLVVLVPVSGVRRDRSEYARCRRPLRHPGRHLPPPTRFRRHIPHKQRRVPCHRPICGRPWRCRRARCACTVTGNFTDILAVAVPAGATTTPRVHSPAGSWRAGRAGPDRCRARPGVACTPSGSTVVAPARSPRAERHRRPARGRGRPAQVSATSASPRRSGPPAARTTAPRQRGPAPGRRR